MEIETSSLTALVLLIGPLATALVALAARRESGLRPRRVLRLASGASGLALLAAFAGAVLLLLGGSTTSPLLGAAGMGLSFRLDPLSVTMTLLVAFIAAVVFRFSRNYLDGDARQGLFSAELALTVASVLLLVSAGNLVQLVAAWMLGSIALQRLLLFHGDRPRAIAAARKKHLIARGSDLALLAGAGLLVLEFGSTDIGTILAGAREMAGSGGLSGGLQAATALLALAALLKSAQFPAHVWLPESMETPTPVSALLHAGVVNAGGFLVIRFADLMLLAPAAMIFLLVVGGFTACFGSLVMVVQTNVKAKLAWSTIAQMGLMIFQCGLGAFAIAVLHIVAHSLYKAQAFLASGSGVESALERAPGAASGAPRVRSMLLGLLAAAVLMAGLDLALGGILADKQGALFLAAILVLGIAPMIAAALERGAGGPTATRGLVTAAGLCLAYLGLTAAVGALFENSLPAASGTGMASAVIAAFVVAGLAVLTLLPALSPRLARFEAWARLKVHLRQGLYLSTWLDRRLRQPRAKSSTTIRGVHP